MHTSLTQPINLLAHDFKQSLHGIYGNQLAGLVLFGSYARGDFDEESDVDFAIVLKGTATRPASEVIKLAPLSAELSLKYGLIVSILPVSEQKLGNSGQGVYEAIRKEGIWI